MLDDPEGLKLSRGQNRTVGSLRSAIGLLDYSDSDSRTSKTGSRGGLGEALWVAICPLVITPPSSGEIVIEMQSP